jgi:hypothetical protein
LQAKYGFNKDFSYVQNGAQNTNDVGGSENFPYLSPYRQRGNRDKQNSINNTENDAYYNGINPGASQQANGNLNGRQSKYMEMI